MTWLGTRELPNPFDGPREVIEFEIVIPDLTDAGRKWAEAHAAHSIVANVALDNEKWPAAHRRLATIEANMRGARDG